MTAALEARLASNGVDVGRLESTMTALPFYRALGWRDAGPGKPDTGYPMRKRFRG